MKRPDLWTVHNIIAHPLSELLYLCGRPGCHTGCTMSPFPPMKQGRAEDE